MKEYAESLLALRNSGIDFQFDTQVNESLVTRARCTATQRFLHSKCDRMLFIDSDIQFPVHAVQQMIDSDADVCVCPYPKKFIYWDRAQIASSAGKDPVRASASLAINKTPEGNVKDGATGFMMIKRHVLEKMQERYPELKVRNDHENAVNMPHYWALFDTMIDDGRYLSEDYAFCRRWQAMGGHITLLEPTPRLGHVGNLTFAGQFNLIS